MYLPPPLKIGEYRCIVVDPPWDQRKTGLRKVRPNQGILLDYTTLTQQEILEAVPMHKWSAENAFLWLWATNSRSLSSGKPIIQQAFELMHSWGFQYYTMVTWDKRTGPCPFGPYQITTEHCLFGYRGKCRFSKDSLGKMQTSFYAPVVRHSEKPAIFYENIRRYFPSPRLDVFSRHSHQGFDGWGLESEREVA